MKKHCKSCEGYEKPISFKESNKYLERVSRWKLNKNRKSIIKNFKFNNFKDSLKFVNDIGKLAEKEGHHPDIKLHSYRKVKISLTTHAINGLSENDFILASKIDKIL